MTLYFQLLGGVSIEEDGQPAAVMKYSKGCALLAYLIVTKETHRRELLADLLWEANSTAESLRNLRQLLYRLKREVPELHITRRQVSYRPETATVDLYLLETALASKDVATHDTALRHYTGELLAGFYLEDAPLFNEWLLLVREQLQKRVYDSYNRLCERYAVQQMWEQLIPAARRWLVLDELVEDAHYWLIQGLKGAGRPQAALVQYQNYMEIMANELGVEPSPKMSALYEQMYDFQPFSALNRLANEWGEAPRVTQFFGREGELKTVTRWLTEEASHLVAILGMGGQGKTALVATVARAVADQFDSVFWRSVLNGPLPQTVLPEYLSYLSENQSTPTQLLSEQLAALRSYLQNGRHLLILDNLETIMDAQKTGHFREGYEGYEMLLQLFGQEGHQSCLLLTSREAPAVFARLIHQSERVQQLPLSGLAPQASRAMLTTAQLEAPAEVLAILSERYSGNPLSLKLTAQTIQEFYFGDVEGFLNDETLIFDDIRDILDQQIQRLSALELDILLWLAVIREATTPQDLSKLLMAASQQRSLFEAFRRLQRRSLLERQAQGFVLQNVITEYLTAYLVTHVVQEIVTGRFNLLLSHALMLAQSKEHIRQSQIQVILRPLAQALLAEFRDEQHLANHIQQLLDLIRQQDAARRSYAAGNLLNLLLHLDVDVSGYNFSRLSVWQADLKGQSLPAVDFSGADLGDTLFTDVFDQIYTIAYSPNGQLLAAGAINGTIRLWDTATYKPTMTLTGQGEVWSLAFSPDSRLLASGGVEDVISLWSMASGQLIHQLKGHEAIVNGLAFSPDGRTLASCSSDWTIRLWDVDSRETKQILTGHTGIIQDVTFSPDGSLLASGSRDRTVRLWSLTEGHLSMSEDAIKILPDHNRYVYTVAFSPDAQTLASADEDGNIYLWDLPAVLTTADETSPPHRRLSKHTDGVESVAFSPDGQTLVSASYDHTVRLWQVSTGQQIQILQGHTSWVKAVVFSPNGQTIASSSWDETVRLWQVERSGWRSIRTIEGYSNLVFRLAFSPDGQMLASSHSDNQSRVWDFATGQINHAINKNQSLLFHIAFSPDGRLLATCSFDHTVGVWETETFRLLFTLRGHQDYVRGIAFSPDSETLATGSHDQSICLWNMRSGELEETLNHHRHWVNSVAFSPDGRYLASTSVDRTVVLWNRVTREVTWVLNADKGEGVHDAVFSPDGTLLATAGWGNSVRLWNVATAEEQQVLQGHTKWSHGVAFSPDGQTLASSSYDQTVRLWDVMTGRLLHVLQGHSNRVFHVAFSPDGRILASCANKEIKLWDPSTGDLLQTWTTPGPYHDMKIFGVTGLKEAQRSALKALGAVEVTGEEGAQ